MPFGSTQQLGVVVPKYDWEYVGRKPLFEACWIRTTEIIWRMGWRGFLRTAQIIAASIALGISFGANPGNLQVVAAMRDPALLNSCGTVGIFCVLYSAVFLRIIWHESAKDWRFTEKLLKRPSRYKQYIFVDFLAAAPATIVGTIGGVRWLRDDRVCPDLATVVATPSCSIALTLTACLGFWAAAQLVHFLWLWLWRWWRAEDPLLEDDNSSMRSGYSSSIYSQSRESLPGTSNNPGYVPPRPGGPNQQPAQGPRPPPWNNNNKNGAFPRQGPPGPSAQGPPPVQRPWPGPNTNNMPPNVHSQGNGVPSPNPGPRFPGPPPPVFTQPGGRGGGRGGPQQQVPFQHHPFPPHFAQGNVPAPRAPMQGAMPQQYGPG